MTASYRGIVKPLLVIWAISCILLFISFPGKVSYVQWSDLSEWQVLPEKLARLEPVRDLVSLLGSFAGVLVFFISCTSLGVFFANKLKIDDLLSQTAMTSLAMLATEFLIGHGVYSLIFLALDGLFQLAPIHVILILLVGFLLGMGWLQRSFLSASKEVNLFFKEGLGHKRDKLIVWLSISILFASLLYSSARISYDASAIYFSDAKLTAMRQHIQYFLDDTFVASVFQTAIQFTALILLFGDQSARLLSWIFGIIVIIFSLALGKRVGISRPARPILFVLLITSTAFLDLVGDGKVDLMSTAPAIAAVYWMVVEGENKTRSRSLLLLIGALCGLAIVARPFNAVLLVIFTLLLYLQRLYFRNSFEPLDYRQFANSLLWIGIGTFGLGIYHLFANWMILGSPFAFLSSVSKINPAAGPWDYYPDQFLAIRLFYPFVATFHNSPPGLGNISPLFIAFLPALMMQEIRQEIKFSRKLYVLIVISSITLLVWIFSLFTVFEIRYVMFLWTILFIPAAEIIGVALESKDNVIRNVSSGLIIILLAFNVLRTIYISLDKYSPLDEQGNPQCFCEFLDSINTVASPNDRVLGLTAYRYYLRSDLFANSTKHDEYRSLQAASRQNNEALWLEVYKQGYKYIAYEHEYTDRHLEMALLPGPDNAPAWLELEELYSSPGDLHVAYRIIVKEPPDNP